MTGRARASAGAGPGALLSAHWPAVCVLLVIVASSYKWRVRDPTEAVSGSFDIANLVEIGLFGAVGLGLLVAFRRDLPLRHPPRGPLAAGAGYIGLLVVSASYSPYPAYAVVRAGEALVVLALAAALARHASRAQLHGVAHAFVGLVVASVAVGVLVPFPVVSPLQVGRFTWLSIHPNVSSVFSALALVLAVSHLSARTTAPGPRWGRPVHAVAAAVCAGALLASQTRGAAAGALAGCALVVLLHQPLRARVQLALALPPLAGLLGFAASSWITGFVTRGEDPEQLATLNARTDLWGVAVEAVERRPLFGYGVGSPRGIFYEATGLGGGHNEIINVVVEVGLVGLAVWTAFVAGLLVRSLRGPRGGGPVPDAPVLLATTATIVIAGIFYDGPGAIATLSSTWLFVVAGWLGALTRPAGVRLPTLSERVRPPAAPAPGPAPASAAPRR